VHLLYNSYIYAAHYPFIHLRTSYISTTQGGGSASKGRKIQNDKYDEAVDVSASFDHGAAPGKALDFGDDTKQSMGMAKGSEQSKSQSVLNKPFDEALEFSHSGSDDSVATADMADSKKPKKVKTPVQAAPASQASPVADSKGSEPGMGSGGGGGHAGSKGEPTAGRAPPKQQSPKLDRSLDESQETEEDEDGDAGEESYDNIEGAYNPRDFDTLNVSAEVRDLFQYIDRYKPQEQDLDTVLKCFIPDYIPAIGEMDAFIKIPRPDAQEDSLGLNFLDEPSSNQSDPTVLELQLRAQSKKMQYGDVSVRSIENAHKRPDEVDKWIRSIADLHRSKPPPQVTYKRNMPDIDAMLDMWPPEFEDALATLQLPSPDLDMSLGDYARTLCTILDIPTYDNPIESLHLMFTVYTDFRNNPHFQARLAEQEGGAKGEAEVDREAGYKVGDADVMEIVQGK
jgi:intraflagellar transport protein 46